MKKKPLRTHSFWGDGKSVIAFAHRGGSSQYGANKHERENTLEAFSAVSELGYRYIELDVITTADGEAVVLHVAKNRLESMLGKKDSPNSKQIQKMRYEQLKSSLVRDIPTLKQVFSRFPDTKFLIDAKSDEVIQPLAEVIINTKATNRVCVGSFYPPRLERLKQLLGDKVCLRLIISRSPLHLYRQLRYLKKAHNDYISAVDWPYVFLNPVSINWAHKHSLRILAWTPNSRRAISRCLDLGADGIISDRAGLLKGIILENNPQNSSLVNRI